ncbi:MAG: PilZ domain-containing protein [Magnetococcus sp. YQC-3]
MRHQLLPCTDMNERNKRTATRLPYTTAIRLKIKGREWSGRIENFSTNGVLVHLDAPSGGGYPALEEQGVLISQVDEVDLESPVRVVRAAGQSCGLSFTPFS